MDPAYVFSMTEVTYNLLHCLCSLVKHNRSVAYSVTVWSQISCKCMSINNLHATDNTTDGYLLAYYRKKQQDDNLQAHVNVI